MNNSDTFDYIVVGGGAAGCAVAGRLSENPSNRVILLEAGGDDRSIFLRIPVLMFAISGPKSGYNWHFETDPVSALNNRKLKIEYGKVLGGGSSINGMQYSRGNPREYDAWRDMGCEGWGFDGVLPYFKKAETNARGADHWHGDSGPLKVRQYNPRLPICEAFLAGAQEAGFPIVDDVNRDALEGFGYSDVNIYRGRRISASSAYIRPAAHRRNLTVLTRAQALRIVVEGGKATGIEIAHDGNRRAIRCEREVILCAGGIKSPHLLLLSGIGPPDDLRSFGIPVAVDLPGVGANFQNHLTYRAKYACADSTTTYKYLKPGNALKAGLDYALFRGGPIGESVVAVFGFWRSDPTLQFGDTHISFVTTVWSSASSDNPSAWELLPKHDGFSCSIHINPFSRGRISLKSANPLDHPRIATNYYDDPRDMPLIVKAVQRVREVVAGTKIRRLIKAELAPGSGVRDAAELEAEIRRNGGNSNHPAGSCAMGSNGTSVVDPQLRVRGVRGIRVADPSIMPTLLNAGTHGPAIMIGEKAAALIADSGS